MKNVTIANHNLILIDETMGFCKYLYKGWYIWWEFGWIAQHTTTKEEIYRNHIRTLLNAIDVMSD